MFKKLFAVAGVLAMLAPAAAFAETPVTLEQLLKQGNQGDQVKILQIVLSADSLIYPEGLITGYYGVMTAKSVRKFQKKNGLAQVGNVGPKTLKLLQFTLHDNNLVLVSSTSTGSTSSTSLTIFGRVIERHDEDKDHDDDNNDNDDEGNDGHDRIGNMKICSKVPPGHLIARGWLRKHHGTSPIVSECHRGKGTTTPDIIPPVISSVSVGAITTANATVSWNTNESATSKVYYSASSPLNFATASAVSSSTLVTAHAISLPGLNPSTVYYFAVESKDGSNNTATTSQMSFTTLAIPDTTPPIISGISTSGISSTTATLLWNTNEAATSKVYYATTTPLNLATTFTVSSSTLVTAHAANLTGLTASSTYYYVLESKDASNNTTTSSGQTFLTIN